MPTFRLVPSLRQHHVRLVRHERPVGSAGFLPVAVSPLVSLISDPPDFSFGRFLCQVSLEVSSMCAHRTDSCHHIGLQTLAVFRFRYWDELNGFLLSHSTLIASSTENTKMPGRVLIVDDDEGFLITMKQLLELAGHRVLVASTFEEGGRVLRTAAPDVLIAGATRALQRASTHCHGCVEHPGHCDQRL